MIERGGGLPGTHRDEIRHSSVPLMCIWPHIQYQLCIVYSGRLDFTRSGMESSLSITEVQESDSGVYQCVVEDSSEEVATSNELLVVASKCPWIIWRN